MPFGGAAVAGGGGAAAATGLSLGAKFAIGATIGGTILQVLGARQQAKQQSALAKYNAQLEIQRAERLKQVGKTVQEQRKEDIRRLLARQRVDFAKGGVIGTTGTPLTVGLETAGREAYNAIIERHNTEIGVSQAESRAEIFGIKAKSAKSAGKFNVGASLLTGVSQVANISSIASLNT